MVLSFLCPMHVIDKANRKCVCVFSLLFIYICKCVSSLCLFFSYFSLQVNILYVLYNAHCVYRDTFLCVRQDFPCLTIY